MRSADAAGLTSQPVDRKSKDNQKLFSGTFDVLKLGEAVLVFPEGASNVPSRAC